MTPSAKTPPSVIGGGGDVLKGASGTTKFTFNGIAASTLGTSTNAKFPGDSGKGDIFSISSADTNIRSVIFEECSRDGTSGADILSDISTKFVVLDGNLDTMADVVTALEIEKSSISNAIIVFNDSVNRNKMAISQADHANTDEAETSLSFSTTIRHRRIHINLIRVISSSSEFPRIFLFHSAC